MVEKFVIISILTKICENKIPAETIRDIEVYLTK